MNQKRTYKLHELIEAAKAGKKFTAKTENSQGRVLEYDSGTVLHTIFSPEAITADWTVTFEREPRVVWFYEHEFFGLSDGRFDSEESAKRLGKPVKFIEVLEPESEEG